jgi:hypothetical protein
MRAILDPVDPACLRAPFLEVFRCVQRGNVLERFVYLDGYYLVSLDGTTYFSASKIHCSSRRKETRDILVGSRKPEMSRGNHLDATHGRPWPVRLDSTA